MKTVTILAATLVGLTPLPLSHSFQTLSAHPNTLSAPSLPVLTAPSLPALTPPLFQHNPAFHGTVPAAPLPNLATETSGTITPVLPVEEPEAAGDDGGSSDMAIQPTPGRTEEEIEAD